MAFTNLRLELGGRVARLTLNGPRVLNAMNFATVLELEQALERLEADQASRVVLVAGAGGAFSTGIDLKELAAEQTPFEYHERFEHVLRGLELLPKVIIAVINGWCLGGGLQLALACDIRIAHGGSLLGLPALKESLIPRLATFRLRRYVGLGWAKRLGGENLEAGEAAQIGLVEHVLTAGEFEEGLDRLVEHYLAAASEGARLAKVLLNRPADTDHADFLQEYLRLQLVAQTGEDFGEAQHAYREGRPPRWL